MPLPDHTFNYQNSDFMSYPPDPCRGDGVPFGGWFEDNLELYLYSAGHIIREAVAYQANAAPNNGGIYFLLIDDAIMYVGLSVCISKRLQQHKKSYMRFNRFWCFGGVPKMCMESIEALYIHTLKPPFNKLIPYYSGPIKALIDQALNGELLYPNT